MIATPFGWDRPEKVASISWESPAVSSNVHIDGCTMDGGPGAPVAGVRM